MTSKTQNSAKATKPIEDAVAAGKQTVEQAVKASTEGYEQAIAQPGATANLNPCVSALIGL